MSIKSICNILRQNNLIKPNKKVSQIKPIKIIKIKYSDNKSTHMDNVKFYEKHYKKGNIENFYLSNCCNKTFLSGGSQCQTLKDLYNNIE